MEVSFLNSSEKLCSRFEWDLAPSINSLLLREPETSIMEPALPSFDYRNVFVQPLNLHSFAHSTTAIAAQSEEHPYLGFLREQRSEHLFQSVEEFRSLLFAHSEPADAEKVLGRSHGGEDFCASAQKESFHGAGGEEGKQGSTASDLDMSSTTISLIPMDVVCRLRRIAIDMANEGYAEECFHAFVSIRKAMLEETLSSLGMQKMSMEEVQRLAWEDMAAKISKWIRAFMAAMKVLYASEKMLCKQIFSSSYAEESFAQITKSSFMRFVSFAEGIVISRRSPEKLMKVLDMYETICELQPWIDSLFCDDSCNSMRTEANRAMVRLGEAARATFSELENAIRRDPSKVAIAKASIHPLTRYVMNYIRLLVCYAKPLSRLLGEARSSHNLFDSAAAKDMEADQQSSTKTTAEDLSPLGVELAWLVALLEYNLDSKSKLYKDMAQAHFFLMNNSHYIVQKVRSSEELALLLGDGWIRKQLERVRGHAMNYRRCGWRKVLGFLMEDGVSRVSGGVSRVSGGVSRVSGGVSRVSGGNSRVSGGVSRVSDGFSRVSVKEKLKGFNGSFEDVCREQASWMVPDPELCEELRISITEKVINAYRRFLAMNHGHLDSRKHKDKYVRYTEEELERCLLQLFEGRN